MEYNVRFIVEEGIKVEFVSSTPNEMIFNLRKVSGNNDVTDNLPSEKKVSAKNTKRIDKELMAQMRKDGFSVSEIAKRFGCKESTVIQYTNSTSTKRRESKIDKKLLIKLWNDGVSASEIAKRFSCKEATIYNYVTMITECVSRKKEPSVNTELFKKMWNDGISTHEIAEQFGIKPSTVYNYSSKIAGCIPRRSKTPRTTKTIVEETATSKSQTSKKCAKSGEHLRSNEIAALLKMFNEGKTPTELADYFRVTTACIHYQLRTHGYKV